MLHATLDAYCDAVRATPGSPSYRAHVVSSIADLKQRPGGSALGFPE